MFHDRMKKEVMHTPTDATMKVEGTVRHKNGVNIPDSSVTVRVVITNYIQ